MSFKRTIKRFAHASGYTFASYSEDGGQIITCGKNDGDVRIWNDIGDDDPVNFCAGETVLSCAQFTSAENNPILITSNDRNVVQCFSYPSGDRDRVMFRFGAPVTTIKVNDKWIAAGSEDFTLKVQKRQTTDEFIELKGHEGPVLQIDLSSKDLLASSSGDGTIRIWMFTDNPPKVVKTIEGLPKANEFSAAEVYSTPSFNPQGNYFAFPKDKHIHVLDTATWETKFKLENARVSAKFTTSVFSSCGKFLAAGSLTGEISVWNMKTQALLKGEIQGDDPHAITSMAWNPSKNGELVFCDADGQLGSLLIQSSANVDQSNDIEKDEVEQEEDDIYDGIDFRQDEADEDEDNENCVSLGRIINETLKKDDMSDDDESVKSVIASERFAAVKPFKLQPPFQPGSTPVDLEHRFMVLNHVGQVLCHAGEENSIIAEFHDVTIHPSLHILNNLNHEMASLSPTCLILATRETPCRVVCISFASSGGKEWSTTMPDCEEIQAIAAGESFVAVATDAGFIRVFTLMGTQREVVVAPGPVVALAASEDKLAVAYHTSSTSNKFSIMLLTHFGLSMTNRDIDLPLTANSKLSWLGFSDRGSVVASDSSGRVITYNIKRNLWYPIGDLTNNISGASDNFFIISVSEKDQKIRATLCRGTNYPLTTPRPIVREIEYAMPLCYLETEKSKIEEAMVRAITFNADSSDKSILENGLKLFSAAINSEQESRAFEIVELIGDRNLITLAAKYASQKGRIHMSNKISNLLLSFDEKEKKRQELLKSIEKDAESFAEIYEQPTAKTVEKETLTPTIAPMPMLNQRKLNRFKKSSGPKNISTPCTPLEHLTKKSIGFGLTPNHSDDENTPVNTKLSSSSNRSIGFDTPRPESFTQWFMANKETISTSNANATDSELFAIGKKIFKELTQNVKIPTEKSETFEHTNGSMNKRKLNMNDELEENGGGGGISKLAKFGFSEDD